MKQVKTRCYAEWFSLFSHDDGLFHIYCMVEHGFLIRKKQKRMKLTVLARKQKNLTPFMVVAIFQFRRNRRSKKLIIKSNQMICNKTWHPFSSSLFILCKTGQTYFSKASFSLIFSCCGTYFPNIMAEKMRLLILIFFSGDFFSLSDKFLTCQYTDTIHNNPFKSPVLENNSNSSTIS